MRQKVYTYPVRRREEVLAQGEKEEEEAISSAIRESEGPPHHTHDSVMELHTRRTLVVSHSSHLLTVSAYTTWSVGRECRVLSTLAGNAC